MTHGKKLILRNKRRESIIYTVKAGDDVIWEGKELHKKFNTLKNSNRGKKLTIGWKTRKEYISV